MWWKCGVTKLDRICNEINRGTKNVGEIFKKVQESILNYISLYKLYYIRMLRWARGKTRLDHVRNVDIWKEAHMHSMAEFLREKRLRWFGHVQRRDKDDATRKILQMTVDGKRNRGRPMLRWRDLVKDDMA